METQSERSRRRNAEENEKCEKFYDTFTTFRGSYEAKLSTVVTMETQSERSRRSNAEENEKCEKFYDKFTAFRGELFLENVSYEAKLSTVVTKILKDYEELKGSIIGKIFVSEIIIAEGGTIIYEGLHNLDMPVAVKRIVQQGYVKSKEYQSLRAIEVHQNIIPLIDFEKDDGFEYLAFERCLCDLFTLFRAPVYTQDAEALRSWKDPLSSDLPCKLRAIIAGVVHLHDAGFAHTKLKPHNVLISAKTLVARISNFGHCRKLDDNERDALVGTDSFSLGCIVFFCFSKGENPFLSDEWEEANIVDKSPKLALVEGFPEASHLIVNLVQPQLEKRLIAKQALNHPLFWELSSKYQFLCQVSGWLEAKDVDQCLVGIRLWTARSKIFDGCWNGLISSKLIKYSTLMRSIDPAKINTYNFCSLEELLRICRNTLVHHRQLPLDIKKEVGSDPGQIYEYFEERFPNMFIEVYDAVYQECPEDPTFQGYFSRK